MSKKFLSDVLIECGLQVDGTTTLGTATATTVATSDNSTNIATTAFVKAQGYITGYTNNYLTTASFNTANGVLTLSRQGLTDVTVDLDNRYLTAESDTLDTVTSRSGVTTNTIGVGTINVTGSTAGAELLTVDGSYGRLFTVTDDLTDSLFSVNTVAGLPALEVFADNSIKLGAFANPIEIDGSSNIVIPGTITASGYNDSNWNAAYNDRIISAAVTGTTTKTITLNQQDGGTVTATWTDINTDTDGYINSVSLTGSTLTFGAVGSAFTGSIDLSTITSSFNASDVQTVYGRVKNVSGAPIFKGTPLAVVPGQTSGNISDVIPADAANPAKMPAIYIANEDIAEELEGEAVLFGEITGIDTSLYQSGTTVYVAAGGGWTATKPVHPNLIQNLGVITKQHATNGGGVVTGVGRANALPNITAGKIWIGTTNYPIESTTVHVDEANGRLGIGTTSPSEKLEVAGNIKSNHIYAETYRSSRTDGDIYIQAATATDFVSIGTVVASNLLRVQGDGNVGIGTATPQKKLDVRGGYFITSDGGTNQVAFVQGGSGYAYFGNYSTGKAAFGNSENWTTLVADGGNVGIGTTAPEQLLHTVGGTVKIESDGAAAAGAILELKHANNNTTDVCATINMTNGVGGYAAIEGGTTGANNTGYIAFKTDNAGTQGEAMRIIGNGNVGIGTTSPNYKLDVAGNAYFQSYVSTSSYYTGPLYKVNYGGSYNGFNSVNNEAILARVSSTSGIINYAEYAINNLNGYVIGQSDAMIKGNYSSDDLYILTTNAVRFYVASNSNGGGVGIGTAFNDSTPPQEKLHVKGNIRIDDSTTSATLSTYSQICNGGTSVYEILDIASTYGAFIDYVIYDSGRDNMRAGTFKATWNSNETVYSDNSTVDIGDTTQIELTSQLNGTDVELAVTGPTQFTVKFSIKVIR